MCKVAVQVDLLTWWFVGEVDFGGFAVFDGYFDRFLDGMEFVKFMPDGHFVSTGRKSFDGVFAVLVGNRMEWIIEDGNPRTHPRVDIAFQWNREFRVGEGNFFGHSFDGLPFVKGRVVD